MPSDCKLGRTYLGTVPRSSPTTRVAPLSANTMRRYSSPSRLSVINWDRPVFSPLDRALVIFEIRFRRRAPRPIEMEDVPLSENIGAIITDTEGNVAHASDVAFLSKFSHLTPLLVGDPLHVG